MPRVTVADGTAIRYHVSGDRRGEPVLLLMGLGVDSRGWLFQRAALGADHRCITVDNRGVGRSDRPPGPYDLEVMAADAVAALDAAGIGSAHVVGASMGGVLAQILAVRHPERVRSLVLACTACRHHAWRRQVLAEWAEVAATDGMGTMVRRSLRWLVGPRSVRRLAPAISVLGPLAMTVPSESFVAQVDAILGMDDGLRHELSGIRVPTLVTVGSQDVLTPRGDSEELAELIPGAELAVVRGGAHLFMVEQAFTFNRVITRFLGTVAATRSRAPGRSGSAPASG